VDLPENQPQHLYSVYSNDDVVPRLKVPIALKECEITTDISIGILKHYISSLRQN